MCVFSRWPTPGVAATAPPVLLGDGSFDTARRPIQQVLIEPLSHTRVPGVLPDAFTYCATRHEQSCRKAANHTGDFDAGKGDWVAEFVPRFARKSSGFSTGTLGKDYL